MKQRKLQAKRYLGSSMGSDTADGVPWAFCIAGCAPLHLAQTSPADRSQNQDYNPQVLMSRLGQLLLLEIIAFQWFTISFSLFPWQFAWCFRYSTFFFCIFIYNERGVTRDNHKKSEYKRSFRGFGRNTDLCFLLWAELCPLKFVCWSLNPQYLMMWPYLELGQCRCN